MNKGVETTWGSSNIIGCLSCSFWNFRIGSKYEVFSTFAVIDTWNTKINNRSLPHIIDESSSGPFGDIDYPGAHISIDPTQYIIGCSVRCDSPSKVIIVISIYTEEVSHLVA